MTAVDEEMVIPDFREGGDEGEKASKEEGGAGSTFDRVRRLKIEDDMGIEYVRFLTDKLQQKFVLMHGGVKTKPAPPDAKNWPPAVMAVCRKDKKLVQLFKGKCYVCDTGVLNNYGKPCTPQIKYFALAVRREPVIGTEEMKLPLITAEQVGQPVIGSPEMAERGLIGDEQVGQAIVGTAEMAKPAIKPEEVGRRIGFRDKMITLTRMDPTDPEGKKTIQVTEPDIVLVNQSAFNFFSALNSMYSINDTLCDRDYLITRKGAAGDKNTKYLPAPMDPIPDVKPGTPIWDYYLQCAKNQGYDLNKIIFSQANDNYYDRFIDPTRPFPPDTFKKKDDQPANSNGTPPAAQPAQAPISQQVTRPNELTPDKTDELRSKIFATTMSAPAVEAAATQWNFS